MFITYHASAGSTSGSAPPGWHGDTQSPSHEADWNAIACLCGRRDLKHRWML